VPSSMIVRSAAVFTSRTRSKPISFSDATSKDGGKAPGSSPNSSEIANLLKR
jgi:hypothetical protein